MPLSESVQQEFFKLFARGVFAIDSEPPPHPLFGPSFPESIEEFAARMNPSLREHPTVQLLRRQISEARPLAGKPFAPEDVEKRKHRFAVAVCRIGPDWPTFVDWTVQVARQRVSRLLGEAIQTQDAYGWRGAVLGGVAGLVARDLSDTLGLGGGEIVQVDEKKRHAAMKLRRIVTVEALDFDPEAHSARRVTECDEESVSFECSNCHQPQRMALDAVGAKVACPSCKVPTVVPCPSAGLILAERRRRQLSAEGKTECPGCGAAIQLRHTLFQKAGFCSRACLLKCGADRFHLAERFHLDGETVAATCKCGTAVLLSRGALGSIADCSCGLKLLVPELAAVTRAATKTCRTCGKAAPFAAKQCPHCHKLA